MTGREEGKMERDIYILEYSQVIEIMGTQEVVEDFLLTKQDIDNPCSLSGIVKDTEGEVIEGASVKIFTPDFTPIKHELTLQDGSYVISNIPAGTYLVMAACSLGHFKLSSPQYVTLVEGNVNLNDFVLTLESIYSVIYGVVKSELGRCVCDATVRVSQIEEDIETIVAEVMTAKDGEYLATVSGAGNYVLDIVSRYYVQLDRHYVSVIDNEYAPVDIIVREVALPPEGTINGVITDKKTTLPIEGAEVALYSITDDGEIIVDFMKTDSDGRYFFGYVPEGKYVVKAKL